MPNLVNRLMNKIKRVPWVFKQPLTRLPHNNLAKISDLFVWRCCKDWQTSFELLNLTNLFGETDDCQAEVYFFNIQGEVFHSQTVELNKGDRQILNISEVLTDNFQVSVIGEFGTFAIFHSRTPKIVTKLKSFIAERGYISYNYKKSALSSYVHGNLDAIEKSNNTLSPLGGVSFLHREYCLQYQFLPNFEYDIVLTNPCLKVQNVTLKILSFTGNKVINILQESIKPKGSFVYHIKNLSTHSRMIVHSKMIMARPVIFATKGNNMDVFHG